MAERTQFITTRNPAAYDLSLLAVRLAAGVIFMAHGAQKLFGVWGGSGLEATVDMLGPIGYPVAIGEFFGGFGLVVGFLTRFSALSLIIIMIGAIVKVHGQNGFFLDKGGYEYNIALIGLLLPTLLAGPGRIAIGRLFMPKSKSTGRVIAPVE